MHPSSLSRRTFLGASAAGLALGGVARAAGERLSVGIVGPGGRGRGLLKTFFAVCKDHPAELTAVCDLWARNRDRAAALVKGASGKEPRKFSHLEDMLAWKGLDAVLIATPDHAHARHLAQCLGAKKHVYGEKPFANTLEEANAALDAYRKSDRVVTVGTQRRSDPRYVAAAALMKEGVVGQVVQVDVIQNAHSPYRWRRGDVKALREKDTDWKAFLMGRPYRKFDPHRYLEFRLYHDYSTGIIDQWMSHLIDTVHLLTGATFPRSVTAQGGCYAWKDGRENGDTVHALLDYPQGFMATYSCTLANGFGSGCRVLGRQGTLEYENAWRVSGAGVKGSKVAASPIRPAEGMKGDMDRLHMADWLGCARKGERKTRCTAEHGYQHAVACIMADRALHTGRRLVFDEKARAIREG
jgi:predicted dehydrogenase